LDVNKKPARRLYMIEETYTPEPSRPCSPEIVCLFLYQYWKSWKSWCRVHVSGRRDDEVVHTRKLHQFDCPEGMSARVEEVIMVLLTHWPVCRWTCRLKSTVSLRCPRRGSSGGARQSLLTRLQKSKETRRDLRFHAY
jgi:hypothetical protein